MDKTNVDMDSIADKIAELTPEQNKTLFFGDVQRPYIFQMKNGNGNWVEWNCGPGLEGLYCGILVMQRRNSEQDKDNQKKLEEHFTKDDHLLQYLQFQIDLIPAEKELHKALQSKLDNIRAAEKPEAKIQMYQEFLAFMRELQPFICRRTYSHEEAIAIIREMIDDSEGPVNNNRTSFADSLAIAEKDFAILSNKVAVLLNLDPLNPNPSRSFMHSESIDGLLGLYMALRFGINVVNLHGIFSDSNQQSRDARILEYMVKKKKYLEEGDIVNYYGINDSYDDSAWKFTEGDILFAMSGANPDADINVKNNFARKMPLGSKLILWVTKDEKYPAPAFNTSKVDIKREEMPREPGVPSFEIIPYDTTVVTKQAVVTDMSIFGDFIFNRLAGESYGGA